MKSNIKQLIKNITPLYNKPNCQSPIETEILFGEYFKILNYKQNWAFGINYNDNYKGWLEVKNLGNPLENNYKVTSLQSIVYERPNIKSKILFNLFIGSFIQVESVQNSWAQIKLNNNDIGFIDANTISSLSYKINDWVNIAEYFIGAPYKWGGKSIMGIDCSGLLQLSLQSSGKKFPRNTEDQFKIKLQNINNKNSLSRGDLVFWNGHVAILQDSNKLLHANQYHMQVFSEDLDIAINRIKEKMNLTPSFRKLSYDF